jgi:hypothetical protein
VFVRDVGNGLLEVSHNGLAFVGLVVLTVAVFVAGQSGIRSDAESYALGWLQQRQDARTEQDDNLLPALVEPDAVSRATAADPRDLNRQQSAVAHWISRRYKVAPEPVSRLVQEAWSIGQRTQLDPTLILAIIAVESGFNPFAQSTVGAQGLMQVMTRVHDDKYEAFGGNHASRRTCSRCRLARALRPPLCIRVARHPYVPQAQHRNRTLNSSSLAAASNWQCCAARIDRSWRA